MNDRPRLIVLIGIVGSGKSHYATRYVMDHPQTIICSSDDMRMELYGNVNNQDHNTELFDALHKRIVHLLQAGKDVIYDATNISSKRRIAFLQEIRNIDCFKIAVVVATPYEICLRQNRLRERTVPEEVIEKMYKSWWTPAYWEGWDFIDVVRYGSQKFRKTLFNWLNPLTFLSYNQKNPHHTETLGYHMINVGKTIENDYPNFEDDVAEAAKIHDCGKPFCRFFDDNGVAHYYGHEHVGAYDALAAGYNLDVSLLINYHMMPLSWKANGTFDKSSEKFHKLCGDIFFNKLMALHRADVEGH